MDPAPKEDLKFSRRRHMNNLLAEAMAEVFIGQNEDVK